jgi:hypothetical protein
VAGKTKKSLFSPVIFQADMSRDSLHNLNNDRQVVDYREEELPPFIEEDEFNTVAKELWLMGYWIEKKHPGYCVVCVEGDEYTAKIVAGYTKGWSETKWTLKSLGHF